MYFVYIIECRDGTLYTGITTDLKRRIEEHKKGIGSHYTKSRGVKRLLFSEEYPDRSSASKREVEIKSYSREKKLELIRSMV